MKRIENDFENVLNDERVKFFGNVFVSGSSGVESWAKQQVKERGHWTVPIDKLREKYSAVILATGAVSDRELGLENEHSLLGVVPSRRIVEYYNGSLDADLTL